jgi:hypothetical protein
MFSWPKDCSGGQRASTPRDKKDETEGTLMSRCNIVTIAVQKPGGAGVLHHPRAEVGRIPESAEVDLDFSANSIPKFHLLRHTVLWNKPGLSPFRGGPNSHPHNLRRDWV